MGIKFMGENTLDAAPNPGDIGERELYLQTDSKEIWSSSDGVDTILLTRLGGIELGAIVLWDGSLAAIPADFTLCDGTPYTGTPDPALLNPAVPDLRNRFILGTSADADVGDTGGTSTQNMPTHTHTLNHNHSSTNTNYNGTHSHNLRYALEFCGSYYTGDFCCGGSTTSSAVTDSGKHSHSSTSAGTSTANTGSAGTAGDNQPPYYTLAYIKRMA